MVPILFIFALTTTAVLLGGIYYGRYIERRNDYIDHILSLTPSVTPSLTDANQDDVLPAYTTFVQESCGISFLIPESGTITESSTSAEVTVADQVVAKINCSEEDSILNELTAMASPSIDLSLPNINEEDIATQSGLLSDDGKHIYITYTMNDSVGRRIEVITVSNLWPIVKESMRTVAK